jgi:uncharacterized NAD(P)/FAD-binding protein YdhS
MNRTRPNICVIGGGFTGAAAAIACLKRLARPFALTIVEPTAALGRGAAYGGHHPLHLLNVRTRDLSILPDRPQDFLNWTFSQIDQGENDPGLHEGLAHSFLPRQLFGAYVRQRLFEAIESRADVDTKIVNDRAVSCRRRGGQFAVRTGEAATLCSDVVMLATAYGEQNASATGALAPHEVLAAKRLMKAKSIALIGSGLTMVDALIGARRDGFSGTATIVSRRGQLPRRHAAKGVVPLEVAVPQSKSVARLTAAIRIACEAAEAHGTPWQAVINGLRPFIQKRWLDLSTQEQRRFLRHVRPFWDAHRHRLPSEMHERILSEFEAGRAVLVRGTVTGVAREQDRFTLRLRRRGSPVVETLHADLAIDCSSYRPDLGQPLIQSLLFQGLARPDEHRLGLLVRPDGQVIDKDGAATRGLFALGPLCQGTLWEITSVPEIVRQADAAAVVSVSSLAAPGSGVGENILARARA